MSENIEPAGDVVEILLRDVLRLIEGAKGGVAREVNSGHVLMCWCVGVRIRDDVLCGKRADYGEKIVERLASRLVAKYGDGFGARNLFRMVRFAEVFPDRKIVSTLSAQLGWSHFVEILQLKDALQRDSL